MSQSRTRIAIIGGGPGGYEAALVAAQLGARVTVIEDNGLGGACVLTDCVPSKTLIATSSMMAALEGTRDLGIRFDPTAPDLAAPDQAQTALATPANQHPSHAWADAPKINSRIRRLAQAQSADVAARLAAEGVDVISGTGRLVSPGVVAVGDRTIEADTVLISTGARPRELEDALPDGERLLTSRQIYDLDELPSELIVVGSGVTGAEFASAFCALGSQVTLVSSRQHVLPNEDTDAAMLIEDVFRRSGMRVLGRTRAQSARRTTDGVEVTLASGEKVHGSHCLLTVGMVPLTDGLGLDQAKVEVDERGFVKVDRVSRTSAPGVYAAGDCTGVLMLASVAAMQGRIAMWHALGEAVHPLRLSHVAATIFTEPEIATVGVSQEQVDSGKVRATVVKMPLATNARAKMDGFRDGFVKLFARPNSGAVLGGVIVAPRASELILSLSLAVERQITVDEVAQTFAVYPSLTGSITEAARRLMEPLE
ncbi:MAG TPA: NAD(P)H-quinone dehydrogenase [Streptosporangiaceae bacterium]|nr:NAD(P)H-quinone dehydrogenase [Streptosporangiaceae bacterium]